MSAIYANYITKAAWHLMFYPSTHTAVTLTTVYFLFIIKKHFDSRNSNNMFE